MAPADPESKEERGVLHSFPRLRAADPLADPGPAVPGRCAFCRQGFPADETEGEFIVTCPIPRGDPRPCDLQGVPWRRSW